MPYRNEVRFIEACLKSLLRQSIRHFQLVAIDDGSDDGSPAIVESLGKRFDGFLHIHTAREGLVEALAAGLSLAEGDAIFRADGDDIYHPLRLEEQVRLLESGVDAAGCLVRFFPRPALMGGFETYERWINRLTTHTSIASELYVETPIAHPSLAVRRSLLESVGGYRACDWPEDFDLMLRLFEAGAIFGKVPRVLHFWREHPDRLCRHDTRYSLEAFIRCRCHYLARGPLSSKKELVLWGAGPIGKKTFYRLRDEGIDVRAFVDIDPRKIGNRISGREVFDPGFLEREHPFVLSCVGKRNARYLVKAELESLGYRERLDYILAA
ncbi:MAG: glycosyltransferase family 2 protein [Planctomycetota bacterium]